MENSDCDKCRQLSDQFIELEKRIDALELRNSRVESDKSWETSNTRILFITLMTYIVCFIVFTLIEAASPWRNALIPTVGYYLSTRSIPRLRAWFYKRTGSLPHLRA
jgi:hypothetical protein